MDTCLMNSHLEQLKKEARTAAFARRKAAFAHRSAQDSDLIMSVLGDIEGKIIAGYMPIRTEIDPLPALRHLAKCNTICLPVIVGQGQALVFSRWVPDGPLRDGPFGAKVPSEDDFITPDVVIVPLVAFDQNGGRLGYGGGFYDRTLEKLRAEKQVRAYGFAFAEQEAQQLPLEPTDQTLDGMITQNTMIKFDPSAGAQ